MVLTRAVLVRVAVGAEGEDVVGVASVSLGQLPQIALVQVVW